MRTKLLAAFLAVAAMTAIGASSASAADVVTFQDENENAYEQTDLVLSDLSFEASNQNPYWSCGPQDAAGAVGTQESNPAQIDEVDVATYKECYFHAGLHQFDMDVEVPEGIALYADGTGEMPVELHQDFYTPGKYDCLLEGTLDITWTNKTNEIEFAGVLTNLAGCGNDMPVNGSLKLQDLWGYEDISIVKEEIQPGPPVWTYEGSPLTTTHEVAFSGRATLYELVEDLGRVECDVAGTLALSPEGKGQLYFEYQEGCESSGYYAEALAPCQGVTEEESSESLGIPYLGQALVKGFSQVVETGCLLGPVYLDGNIGLTPDDSDSISSFAVFGQVEMDSWGAGEELTTGELEGEIELAEPGVYGMQES